MTIPTRWQSATEAELEAELDRMVERLTYTERQARSQRFWIERLRTLMKERFPHCALHQPPTNWLRLVRTRFPPR
jgi:hypothetical protein